MESPEWQQLYVNAEHDSAVGVVTLGREAYNWDVDTELNRALDWLLGEGIRRVILTSDFHLASQLVGADTAEFFPALKDEEAGYRVSHTWSRTARRLHRDFERTVGLVPGKRCLGGMLELMLHCHVVVATDDASLGFPEVTLPVVPGMEGCHWPFRKASRESWPRLLDLLLSGRPVRASEAEGWLIDRAVPLEEALGLAWAVASGGEHDVPARPVEEGAVSADDIPTFADAGPGSPEGRRAIYETVFTSLEKPLDEALEIQSRRSAAFMVTKACRSGAVGKARQRILGG
jgi:enoyl-CoA hydratase/carnithine racemase